MQCNLDISKLEDIMNKARCRKCGTVIHSKSRHDYVSCKCGEIFVDGGEDYYRRGAKDFKNFIDLSYAGLEKAINEWVYEMAYYTDEDIPTPKGVRRFIKKLTLQKPKKKKV